MSLIVYGICLAFGLTQVNGGLALNQTHFRGTFEFEVKQSRVMKIEKKRLECVSAFATDMRRQGPIKFAGIDIFFLPHNTSSAAPNPEELKHGDYANVNLMMDKSGKVTQVNMTVVVPGSTVVRTVAWKSEDLQKYFSNLTLGGNRIKLKSQGTYDDPATDDEQIHLDWNVDIDIPVIRESAH